MIKTHLPHEFITVIVVFISATFKNQELNVLIIMRTIVFLAILPLRRFQILSRQWRQHLMLVIIQHFSNLHLKATCCYSVRRANKGLRFTNSQIIPISSKVSWSYSLQRIDFIYLSYQLYQAAGRNDNGKFLFFVGTAYPDHPPPSVIIWHFTGKSV